MDAYGGLGGLGGLFTEFLPSHSRMPYMIVPWEKGYGVVSRSGKILSNHPLSLIQAKKQKVAVVLSEIRKGVGAGLEGGTADQEAYSLSDLDLEKIVHGIKLFKYPDLHNMSSIHDAFDKWGRAMMLYLTTDDSSGHWVCMIKDDNKKTIEYFDPYGGYSPDGERKWLSPEKLAELGEDVPILSRMIKESGYKVNSNPHHFQKEGQRTNTCGRHSACRLLLGGLSLPQYTKIVMGSGVEPDEFVTELTSRILHK